MRVNAPMNAAAAAGAAEELPAEVLSVAIAA